MSQELLSCPIHGSQVAELANPDRALAMAAWLAQSRVCGLLSNMYVGFLVIFQTFTVLFSEIFSKQIVGGQELFELAEINP
jgi:hypothetical protein